MYYPLPHTSIAKVQATEGTKGMLVTHYYGNPKASPSSAEVTAAADAGPGVKNYADFMSFAPF